MNLKPSVQLAMLLASSHAGAVILVLYLSIPAKIALVILLVIGMIHAIRHHALLARPSSTVFLKIDEGLCQIALKDGSRLRCTVLGSTYVSPWLTALNLKEEGKRFIRSVVILPDALDSETYRRLRVLLRWNPALHRFPGAV